MYICIENPFLLFSPHTFRPLDWTTDMCVVDAWIYLHLWCFLSAKRLGGEIGNSI